MTNALQPTKQVGPPPKDDTPLLVLQPRGLAIFPTRYAVVPNTPAFAGINLPGGMGNKSDVALQHHKYVLRLMRKGFIYVYYHQHPDKKKWDIYQTQDDNTLDQLSVKAFKKGQHKVLLAGESCFFIDKPAEQGKVDFAFSEHPWSNEILQQMESDGALRDKRMQTFRPYDWANKPSYPHGKKLTEDNLTKVLEYSGDEKVYTNFHQSEVTQQPISDDNGAHNSNTLALCTSANTFRMHTDEAAETVKAINLSPNSQRNHPMLLALWDSVGITRELGGFAADAAGWVDQYQEQQSLHFNAINNINIIKAALEAAAKKKNENSPKAFIREEQYRAADIKKRQKTLERMYQRSGSPQALKQDPNYQQNQDRLAETERDIAALKAKQVAHSWGQYTSQINETDIANRQQYKQAIANAAKPLMENRIKDQIAWLESPLLLNALTEYHPQSLVDGRFFENLMGDVFSSMNSCDPGTKKLDEWVAAAALTDDNLFWRAIAANQTQAKDLLTPILDKINSTQGQVYERSTVAGIDKDIYDRLLDFVKLNADSLAVASSIVGTKTPVDGIGKIYTALGSRLITPLIKPGVDTVGVYIVRKLYEAKLETSTQAHSAKYQQRKQALNDHYQQQQANLKNNMHHSRHNMQHTASSRNSGLSELARVHQGNLSKGQNQLRLSIANQQQAFKTVQLSYDDVLAQITADNQAQALQQRTIVTSSSTAFGVLILAMQTTSISQLLHVISTKGVDLELATKFTIALTGIVGTMAGFADNFAKQNSPWSNTLKRAGGRMMVVGGVLAAGLDTSDAFKNYRKGNTNLVAVYGFKTLLNTSVVGLGGASVYASINASWETAWATRLKPYLGAKVVGRLALSRFFFALSIWVSLGIMVIDIGIMLFADDALEDWLQRTPFAKKPEGTAFNTVEDQQAEFEDTIIELFGLPKPKDLHWELSTDMQLREMQQRERSLHNKQKIWASQPNIAANKQYQANQQRLEQLRAQINQRKQQITDAITRYNTQQQQQLQAVTASGARP